MRSECGRHFPPEGVSIVEKVPLRSLPLSNTAETGGIERQARDVVTPRRGRVAGTSFELGGRWGAVHHGSTPRDGRSSNEMERTEMDGFLARFHGHRSNMLKMRPQVGLLAIRKVPFSLFSVTSPLPHPFLFFQRQPAAISGAASADRGAQW